MRIREATPADAAVIAAIYNESMPAGGRTIDDLRKHAADIRRQLAGLAERETMLVLEDGADVVGWGLIKRYSDRPGYRFCGETWVYVRRALTRRGYGSRIQQALVERCKTYGYHHLLARIWARNEACIILHKKLGYEVVGTQREIGTINGRWQDLVIMQRVLRDVEASGNTCRRARSDERDWKLDG